MPDDPHTHDPHDHAHDHDHAHAHGHSPAPAGDDYGTQAMVRTLRLGFASLLIIWVALLVIYLCSGFFILEDNQEAYVLRFGKVKTDAAGIPIIYSSGDWHFALPEPFEKEVRIETKKTHVVQTQSFLSKSTANLLSGEQESAPDDPSANLTVGQDFYALTGDTNIIHGEWSLEYVITDPYGYSAEWAVDPSASEKRENAERYGRSDVIRAALDNAILKAYAHATLEDALYSGADSLREDVHQGVNARLRELNLGIEVTTVNYSTKAPPKPTKAAFDNVIVAEQARDTERQNAEKYATTKKLEAEQEANRLITEAQTYKTTVERRTAADASYFTELLEQMNDSDSRDSVLVALYNRSLASLVNNAKEVYILKPNQQIRVMLNPPIKKKSTETEPADAH